MPKKKDDKQTGYRPGSVGYYLTQRGWEPVGSDGQFPLWRKGDTAPVQAKEALYEVYREIWRECRPKHFPNTSSEQSPTKHTEVLPSPPQNGFR